MSQPSRMPIDWRPIRAIHIPTTTVDQQFITRGGRLYGWAVEETTASAGATIGLYDGTTTNSEVLVSISLLANESTRDFFSKPGLLVQAGVFLHVFSGSVRATIYMLAMSEEEIARQAGYQLG